MDINRKFVTAQCSYHAKEVSLCSMYHAHTNIYALYDKISHNIIQWI